MIPAGAPVVLLDEAVVPMTVAAFERGTPLMVRAAPAGGPPSGSAMTEVTTIWTGRRCVRWPRPTCADGWSAAT
jgi:hypothetical protein